MSTIIISDSGDEQPGTHILKTNIDMNAINVIHPYKYNGQWVFDDVSKELDKEPFVAGADTLIDNLLPSEVEECTVLFSEKHFPSATQVIENEGPGEDGEGGTYYLHKRSFGKDTIIPHKLWLCPALLKYFNEPPNEIHFCLV